MVAACRDVEHAGDLAALQAVVGPRRLALTALDVEDEASIGSWAASLLAAAPVTDNGGVVDVVINNAGTTVGQTQGSGFRVQGSGFRA